jgi:phage terminase large subunit-like protein
MPAKYPHVVKAEWYAQEVIEGKIPACKWIIAACQRHFDDKKRVNTKSYKYKFDREKAERVCVFAELLPHIKGSKFFGKPIHLEPWQCFLLCMVFGWVRKADGRRRFRNAQIMIPRKNGKSTIAAIVGLYMLVADGEAGSEVYSGATTEKQALEVFKPAQVMVQKSPDFQAYFGVLAGARAITQLGTNSSFRTIIGNPGDGASPHCAIIDEYHEHKSDDQVDTMRTGMVARQQPLLFMITTAGDNLAGPCYMEFEDGKKILDGTKSGDETFVLIYTIDEDDDWTSESALRKANPNLGISIEANDLLAEQSNAIQTPRKQSIFQTKHLNVWVGAMNAYFDMQKWRAAADTSLNLEDFKGRECIIGLDLANKVDLNAIEILFPLQDGEYVRFGKYYLPEETVQAAGRDNYRTWVKEGWITQTDGAVVDFDTLRDDIRTLCSLYQVREIAYDPWGATEFAQHLQKDGAQIVEYQMNTKNLSEPMKQLDALIRSGKIRHNGDPVATWCLSNVVAKTDANDNVFPRKDRDESKIDAAVAMMMSLGRSILNPPPKEKEYTMIII